MEESGYTLTRRALSPKSRNQLAAKSCRSRAVPVRWFDAGGSCVTINAFSMWPRGGDIEVVLCPEACVTIPLNKMIEQQKRRFPEHFRLYPLCPKQALFTRTPFYLKEEKYILQRYCPRVSILLDMKSCTLHATMHPHRQSLCMILYILRNRKLIK